MNPPPASHPPEKPLNFTLIAWVVFGLFLLYALLTQRCLYTDGSFIFLKVLEAGGFTQIGSYRDYAINLFAFPMVVALKLGVTNIPCLTLAFGIGCFCAWPVAAWLCYRMAPHYFWLVMLGCAAGYLNAAFMAVGTHIVVHAFFWPVLFAILFVRPLTPFAAGTLLALTALLIRSYESMLFLGPSLIVLLVWRMVHDRERLWRQAVLGAAAIFLAAATYTGWEGVYHPDNPANYGGFKHGVLEQLSQPVWTVKMSLFWAGLLVAALFPPFAKFLKGRVGLISTGLAVVLWGIMPILAPDHINPARQYDSRFLDLLVPLALMCVAVILAVKPKYFEARIAGLVRLSALMLIAQSLWHVSATYEWERTVHDWKNLLATKTGPVFVPYDHNFNEPDLNWSNPCLSLFIGPRHVQAVIMPTHVTWQPFDPFKPSTFPDLKRYGVDYTDYIAALNREKLNHDIRH